MDFALKDTLSIATTLARCLSQGPTVEQFTSMRPCGLMDKAPAFETGNAGSSPVMVDLFFGNCVFDFSVKALRCAEWTLKTLAKTIQFKINTFNVAKYLAKKHLRSYNLSLFTTSKI